MSITKLAEGHKLFKKDFLSKVPKGVSLENKKRLADYAMNTGRSIEDLLLFAAGKITIDDINSKKTFDKEWEENKDEVLSMASKDDFSSNIDAAKHEVYKTLGKARGSDAYEMTWKDRVNLWTNGGFINEKGEQVIFNDSTGVGGKNLPEANTRNTKAVLDTIGKAESDAVGGYNAIVRSKTGDPDLTGMTITEARKKHGNIAIGRYQIIGETMDSLATQMGIDPDTYVLNEENQDALATKLLEEKGLDKYLSGDMEADEFLGNIAEVWRGLPVDATGKGYEEGDEYGNKATISYDDAIAGLGAEPTEGAEKKKNTIEPTKTFKLYNQKTKAFVEFKVYEDEEGNVGFTHSKTDIPKKDLENAVNRFYSTGAVSEGADKDGSPYYYMRGTDWSTRDVPPIYGTEEEKAKVKNRNIKVDALTNKKYEKMMAERSKKRIQDKADKKFDIEGKKKLYEDAVERKKKLEKLLEGEITSSASRISLEQDLEKTTENVDKYKADYEREVASKAKSIEDEVNLQNTKAKEAELLDLKRNINSGEYTGEELEKKKREADALHFELNDANSDIQSDMTAPFGSTRADIELYKMDKEATQEDDVVYDTEIKAPKVIQEEDIEIPVVEEEKVEEEEVEDEETYIDVDVETRENYDITQMSPEYIKKLMGDRDAKLEATGRGGLLKKYGGMDMLLQNIGMYAAYKTATTPLPEQQKSEQWQERMAQLKDRTQLGLDNKTKTLYQSQAERTYAYDVANIANMATSSQAALGSLGAASARKYQSDLKLAATDAELREKHQGEYQSALVRDEAMTQDMWKRNVYDEASRKRDLKSGLLGQAVKNIRETVQYNQQYGDGSLYEQLMTETIKEKESKRRSMITSQATALMQSGMTQEEAFTALGGSHSEEPKEEKKQGGLKSLFKF